MITTADKKAGLLQVLGESRVLTNERITISGEEYDVDFYTEVSTIDDLILAVITARKQQLPFHIIGLGFSPDEQEERIEGLLIKNNCRKFDILSMRGKIEAGDEAAEYAFVAAETGVALNQIVRQTIDEGLGGLEYFLGMTGTVGDSLLENISHGEEDYLISHIFTLRLLTKENEVVEVNAEPFLHPFSENMIQKKHAIPLSVVFKLAPQDKNELWRRGTQAAFERNQSDLLDPLKGNFEL